MTRCRDIRQYKRAGRSVADVVLNPETTRTRRTSVRAFWAWRDNDFFEAARRRSRRRAFEDARERFLEIALFLALRPRLPSPRLSSWLLRTSSLSRGGRSFTPSRRALERPIALPALSSARRACRDERAHLFPDELPCLGGRSLAFALGFTRSSESLLLGRHALRIWPSIKLSFFAFAVRETGTNKGTSRKMQPASIWLIPLSSRLAFDLVKRSR